MVPDTIKGVKKLLFLSLSLCYFAAPAHAADDFRVSQIVDYVYDSSGNSTVTHNFTLTNNSSFSYASSYQLRLQGLQSEPKNLVASDSRGPLTVSLQPLPPDGYQATVLLTRPAVGKNQTLEFKLSYNSDPAKHNGQIWEITLPRLLNLEKIDSLRVLLSVPESFGKPAFLSPQPSESRDNTYVFTKDQLVNTPVIASFGQLQNYTFTIKYSIKNSSAKPAPATIALPPDTSYQHVIYTSIQPPPSTVSLDPDGNWLASYTLGPESQLEITASGQARLLSQPNTSFPQTNSLPVQSDKYWPVDNPDLKDLAKSLKNPKDIYSFVVKHLSYDYSRLTPQSAALRRGALEAFGNPSQSLCTDFTDLFITLARAAGIPAREIQGFAYTTDSRLRPLSLVADILHSWVQYWDEARGMWVSIDPTWGNTTGGDYFSQFDFSHFAFVIHGQSSTTPLPPTDIDIKFAPYSDPPAPPLDISWTRPSQFFPVFPARTTLTVKNNQPWALYRLPVEFMPFSGNLEVLPPFARADLPVIIKTPFFPGFQTRFYTATAGTRRVTYNIGADYFLAWHIFLGITISVIVITAGFIAYRTWSLHLQRQGRKNFVRGQSQ